MKQAFNKYNAPELLSQLMAVLQKEGLEDTVDQLKSSGVPQLIDKAWRQRKMAAVRRASLKAQFEKIKALAEKMPDNEFLMSLLKQMANKGFAPTEKQMAVVKKIEEQAADMKVMQKELNKMAVSRHLERLRSGEGYLEMMPVDEFPLMLELGVGVRSGDLVDSNLFAKAEADLAKKRYSKKEMRMLRHLVEAGFSPGETVSDFKEDRGMEDEDIRSMFKGTVPHDVQTWTTGPLARVGPLPRDFPRSVIKAIDSLY